MAQVRRVELTDAPISADALRAAVADPAAGATVLFTGDVRDNDHGRSVASLTYEVHPNALPALQAVAEEIAAGHPVIALALTHRFGPIPVGEAALVAAVSARHRGEAFAACQALVDLTKARLPIWKHQVFADGTDEWVNCA